MPSTDYDMDSVLDTVKKSLGIPKDHTEFDVDIIMHINSTFSKLYQMGVGPRDNVFSIEDSSDAWSDFINDRKGIEMVKSYMYIDVRLLFDPPTASLLTALQETKKEYEWRLNVAGSSYDWEEEDE